MVYICFYVFLNLLLVKSNGMIESIKYMKLLVSEQG